MRMNRLKKNISLALCVILMISILPKTVFAEDVGTQTTENFGVKNPTYNNQIATYDCVWFGNYMQSDASVENGSKEPIKWRVLSVEGSKALLMADQNLENKRFNDKWNWGVPWENSTLRQWMNADFKDTAFEENEQAAISNHTETGDAVFALSKSEIDKLNQQLGNNGFTDQSIAAAWRGSNTDYLKKCLQNEGIEEPNTGWWLRSNGMFNFLAYYITADGGQDFRNIDESDERGRTMARPCVYLDLSQTTCWSYAGTVSSDGTVNEEIPRKFDYIRDTWNFKNLSSKIPLSTYKMFFEPEKAKQLQEENDGSNGHCAGMCMSVAAIYEGFPQISSFGQYSCLNEIGKDIYSNEAKCKAKEFIDYGYVYQSTEKFLKQLDENKNHYNDLYKAIKDFQYNNGTPVLVGIQSRGDNGGAHMLVGLEVTKETSDSAEILMYDCNLPNQECYLTLTKSNGSFDGWFYDLYGWDDSQKDAFIAYFTMTPDFINDYKTEYAEKNNDTLLMKIQKKANGLLKYGEINELLTNLVNKKSNEITPIIIASGKDTSIYDSYWLDNSKRVDIENLSKDSEIRLSNNNLSITLQNNQEANVSVNMNNQEVTIDSENNNFDVKYVKSLDYENSKIFSIKGKENEKLNIKSTDSNTWEMSGTNGFLVSYETKVYEEEGTSDAKKEQEVELKNANANSVYQIEANETSIIIREDKDKDGVFEKQVIPEDSNNSGDSNNLKPDGTISDSNKFRDNNNSKSNETISIKKQNTSDSVKTGDDSNIISWLLLIEISLIVIAGVMIYKRRRKGRL